MSPIAADPPHVEILVFDGCPNVEPTRELVGRVARELAIDAPTRVVCVPDAKSAQSTRFLGSPAVRVDGHDVEPGAEQRTDFAFSCRVYRTANGLTGQPDETWVRKALEAMLTEAPSTSPTEPRFDSAFLRSGVRVATLGFFVRCRPS